MVATADGADAGPKPLGKVGGVVCDHSVSPFISALQVFVDYDGWRAGRAGTTSRHAPTVRLLLSTRLSLLRAALPPLLHCLHTACFSYFDNSNLSNTTQRQLQNNQTTPQCLSPDRKPSLHIRRCRDAPGTLAVIPNQIHLLTSTSDIIKIICAIVLPPLGVFLERGCGADLLINILLTILGCKSLPQNSCLLAFANLRLTHHPRHSRHHPRPLHHSQVLDASPHRQRLQSIRPRNTTRYPSKRACRHVKPQTTDRDAWIMTRGGT